MESNNHIPFVSGVGSSLKWTDLEAFPTQKPVVTHTPAFHHYRRPQSCGYCRSLGFAGAQTHDKYHCPRLAELKPCPHCGASGIDNHTASHCPNRQKILLPLKRLQPTPWKGLPVPLVAKMSEYEVDEVPNEQMYAPRRFEKPY